MADFEFTHCPTNKPIPKDTNARRTTFDTREGVEVTGALSLFMVSLQYGLGYEYSRK
jgi:hypothetical protein